MSHLPAKRRKLDHAKHDESEDSSPGSALDFELENSSEDDASETDAPATESKRTPQPKRTKDGDNDALYAGGLYKSSIFKLQVDEMLAEVRPNYAKRFSGADDALRQIKSLIEGIEEREALSVPDATKLLQKSHRITIPFPNPKPDKNAAYKLGYARPSNINIIGSYALKTMVKTNPVLSIDMVVVMPASIFQEKDYLNYRYFYKRAFYLACITAGIKEAMDGECSLFFEYLNGNSLHPILIAEPKPSKKSAPSSYRINIIPAAPQAFFPETKLRPFKNAVRPKDSAEQASFPPTPFYNASLKSDENFEAYLKLLHYVSKQSSGFVDACLLGRTWLQQRGFGSSISAGGFGHFEWAALTALLLKGGGPKGHSVLSPGYSSYQTFKAIVQFLSTVDLASNPLIYEASDIPASKSDIPVFYDGPRGQNLLYKMTPWSYAVLRDEAKTSLDMLNDATFDQFESTFILRASQPLQRFDCILHVPIPANAPEQPNCDHVFDTAIFAQRLFDVLREGLSDRVKLIDIKSSNPFSWSIKSSGPSASEKSLMVCFVFDPANIDRLVDHGPAAEKKKKAAKFQEFWGEKAELRRFRDGSILESLVWRPGSTYSIFQDIVSYLVSRHFETEVSQSLTFVGENFENALPSSITAASKHFDALKQAFNIFEKDIRNLDNLPLQLRQLSPIDPQLRYTSINPPVFNAPKPLNTPADVLIQFEGSGRWPDDIAAIQRTKIAFLLKIASLLQDADDSITTRVGIENEDQKLLNCGFLDVIYESGAVFRLRIHNDREQTLLERLIKDKSTDPRTREDAVFAQSTYKRTFIQLPLLSQSVSTHCTRFPLLSPTIRLVKMWFDRHMLSEHVSEELIELIVAHTFLQPYPWRAPSSVMTGLLRTLMFISRWDWRLVPLIVDFTGTMTSKDVSSINTRLEAWRKIDPGMNRTVLFAASNHDMTGTAFTDRGPSKVVAARMTALAVSASKLIKEKGIELDQRSLFATSTNDYDIVIHISSKFTESQKKKEASKPKFKNLEVQSEVNLDIIGYDPVRIYLSELQNLYASSIVFFRSAHSGSVIAGLWNPQALASRLFRVSMAYATKVVNDSEKGDIEIDKEAILTEIARLGGDMVARIEVNR